MWQPEGRRSKIEITADILRLLRLGEVGKTEIMCTVRLTHNQTQKYIKWLLQLELVDEVRTEDKLVSYRVTKDGLKLLSAIENMQEVLFREEVPYLWHAPEISKTIVQERPTTKYPAARHKSPSSSRRYQKVLKRTRT